MDKYYHFTKDEYLDAIRKEGLIPQIGDRSNSVDDDKRAVFISKGEKSAILMFFAMKWFYESHKGIEGDKLLSSAIKVLKENEALIEKRQKQGKRFLLFSKSIEELKKDCEAALVTKKQVENMKQYSSFEEYWGRGVYLSVRNVKDVKYNHPDYHNCWVEREIDPEDISVVVLKNHKTGEMISDKTKVLHYFMATTSLSDLCIEYRNTIGINEDKYSAHETMREFSDYYSEHEDEFKTLLMDYDLVEIPIREFKGEKSSKNEAQI